MMYFFIGILILTRSFGFQQPSLTKTTYFSLINNDIVSKEKIEKNKYNEIKSTDLPDYTIPGWVYKKVFKFNRPTKFKEDKYRYIDRKY